MGRQGALWSGCSQIYTVILIAQITRWPGVLSPLCTLRSALFDQWSHEYTSRSFPSLRHLIQISQDKAPSADSETITYSLHPILVLACTFRYIHNTALQHEMQWATVLILTLATYSSALVRFHCSQLVTQRLDPLINPGLNPSPHVHQ